MVAQRELFAHLVLLVHVVVRQGLESRCQALQRLSELRVVFFLLSVEDLELRDFLVFVRRGLFQLLLQLEELQVSHVHLLALRLDLLGQRLPLFLEAAQRLLQVDRSGLLDLLQAFFRFLQTLLHQLYSLVLGGNFLVESLTVGDVLNLELFDFLLHVLGLLFEDFVHVLDAVLVLFLHALECLVVLLSVLVEALFESGLLALEEVAQLPHVVFGLGLEDVYFGVVLVLEVVDLGLEAFDLGLVHLFEVADLLRFDGLEILHRVVNAPVVVRQRVALELQLFEGALVLVDHLRLLLDQVFVRLGELLDLLVEELPALVVVLHHLVHLGFEGGLELLHVFAHARALLASSFQRAQGVLVQPLVLLELSLEVADLYLVEVQVLLEQGFLFLVLARHHLDLLVLLFDLRQRILELLGRLLVLLPQLADGVFRVSRAGYVARDLELELPDGSLLLFDGRLEGLVLVFEVFAGRHVELRLLVDLGLVLRQRVSCGEELCLQLRDLVFVFLFEVFRVQRELLLELLDLFLVARLFLVPLLS